MIAKVIVAALAVLLLASCEKQVWYKDGATQQDFDVDSYQCGKDWRQYGDSLIGGAFGTCMVAHGWHT